MCRLSRLSLSAWELLRMSCESCVCSVSGPDACSEDRAREMAGLPTATSMAVVKEPRRRKKKTRVTVRIRAVCCMGLNRGAIGKLANATQPRVNVQDNASSVHCESLCEQISCHQSRQRTLRLVAPYNVPDKPGCYALVNLAVMSYTRPSHSEHT